MKYNATTALLSAMLVLPGVATGGGYGTAGVSDATVGAPTEATALVWCPKIKAEIPIQLQAQMDCSDGVAVGTATPVVAPARFGTGLLGLPPHQPKGRNVTNDDDGPTSILTVNEKLNPGPIAPDPADNAIGKWDRLSQLGVDRQNYDQQSQDFRDAVKNYRSTHGTSGDWTNFNPSQ